MVNPYLGRSESEQVVRLKFKTPQAYALETKSDWQLKSDLSHFNSQAQLNVKALQPHQFRHRGNKRNTQNIQDKQEKAFRTFQSKEANLRPVSEGKFKQLEQHDELVVSLPKEYCDQKVNQSTETYFTQPFKNQFEQDSYALQGFKKVDPKGRGQSKEIEQKPGLLKTNNASQRIFQIKSQTFFKRLDRGRSQALGSENFSPYHGADMSTIKPVTIDQQSFKTDVIPLRKQQNEENVTSTVYDASFFRKRRKQNKSLSFLPTPVERFQGSYPLDAKHLVFGAKNVQKPFKEVEVLLERATRETENPLPQSGKLNERMNTALGVYNIKKAEVIQILNSSLAKTRFEYVENAAKRESRDGIQKTIEEELKRKGTHRFCPNAAPMSHFEVVRMPKIESFTDHNGFYISKTGHKIDDHTTTVDQNDIEKNVFATKKVKTDDIVNRLNVSKERKFKNKDKLLQNANNFKKSKTTLQKKSSDFMQSRGKKYNKNLCKTTELKPLTDVQKLRLARGDKTFYQRALDENLIRDRRTQEELEAVDQKINDIKFDLDSQHNLSSDDDLCSDQGLRPEKYKGKVVYFQTEAYKEEDAPQERLTSLHAQKKNQKNVRFNQSFQKLKEDRISRSPSPVMGRKLVEKRQKDFSFNQFNLQEVDKTNELMTSNLNDKVSNQRRQASQVSGSSEESPTLKRKKLEQLSEAQSQGRPYWRPKSNIKVEHVSLQSTLENQKHQSILNDFQDVEAATLIQMETAFIKGNQIPNVPLQKVLVNKPCNKLGRVTLDLTDKQLRFNEANAAGLADAIGMHKIKIQCVEIANVDLTAKQITRMLDRAAQKMAICFRLREISLDDHAIEILKRIIRSRNVDEYQQQFLTTLQLWKCKVSEKGIQTLISSAVDRINFEDDDLRSERQARTQLFMKELFPDKKSKATESEPQKRLSVLPFEQIALSGLQLKNVDFLQDVIFHSPFLRDLDLSYNVFQRSVLDPIMLNLAGSLQMKYLDLSYSPLSKFAIKILSFMLRHSMSLLVLNLNYIKLENPKEDLSEIFRAMKYSQTLQSVHLAGIQGRHIDMEELNKLEKTILGVGIKFQTNSKNMSCAPILELKNQDLPGPVVTKDAPQKQISMKEYYKFQVEQDSFSSGDSLSDEDKKEPEQVQEEEPTEKQQEYSSPFKNPYDENFSIIETENLVYQRFTSMRHFGQDRAQSQKWNRGKICFVTERWNMFIMLCKFTNRQKNQDHPRILVGGDKNMFDQTSVEMVPINQIVSDLKFELGDKCQPDDRRQNMDVLKLAFQHHGRRFGFEPTIIDLPQQNCTPSQGLKVTHVYAHCLMMKPNIKYSVRIENTFVADVVSPLRTTVCQTMFNNLQYFQKLSLGTDPYQDDQELRLTKESEQKQKVAKDRKEQNLPPLEEKKLSKEEKLRNEQEDTALEELIKCTHFQQLKPLFAEAKNLYGKANVYPYQFQVGAGGYNNMTKESMEVAFERDYETSAIERFVPTQMLNNRQKEEKLNRLRHLVKKAYPTLVNMFYYMQANQTETRYYPTVHKSIFIQLVTDLKLMRLDYSPKQREQALDDLVNQSLELLLTQEKNNTRLKIGEIFKKKVDAVRKQMESQENEQLEKNIIFKALKKKGGLNNGPSVLKDGSLNKADLSRMYAQRPEGIRRCVMLELLVRLSMDYYPGIHVNDAVFKYLSNVLPQMKPDKFDDFPSLQTHKFIGIDAYRARFLINPQIDMILDANRPILEALFKKLKIIKGLYVRYHAINKVFGTLFPDFKPEIHTCFVLSKRIDSEETDSREVHFQILKVAFFEFLVRFSRCVTCGSSTRNYVNYNGIYCLAGLGPFSEAQLNKMENGPKFDSVNRRTAEKLERFMQFGERTKTMLMAKAETLSQEQKQQIEKAINQNEEGYLPYYVSLDILFKMIEQKIQYM